MNEAPGTLTRSDQTAHGIVRELHFEGWAELRRYSFEIPGSAEITAQAGTSLGIKAGVQSSSEGHVQLQSVLVEADPPLLIGGLARTTRTQLRQLIKRSLSSRLPFRIRAIIEGLTAAFDTSFSLALRGLKLIAHTGPGGPTLQPQISGEIRIGPQFAIPFKDLPLPSRLTKMPAGKSASLPDIDLDQTLNLITEILESAEFSCKGVVQPPPLEFETPTSTLGEQVSVKLETQAPIEFDSEGTISTDSNQTLQLALSRLLIGNTEATISGSLRSQDGEPQATATVSVHPRSRLPDLLVQLTQQNQHLLGQTQLRMALADAATEIRASLRYDQSKLTLEDTAFFSLRPVHPLEMEVEGPDQQLVATAKGNLTGQVSGVGPWHTDIEYRGTLSHEATIQLAEMPELDIDDGTIRATGETKFGVNLHADLHEGGRADLDGSELRLEVDRFAVTLDGRELSLPRATQLGVDLREGGFTRDGLNDLAAHVRWTLSGGECLLKRGDAVASLLTPALRNVELTLHLDRNGRIHFSGEREGLYGIRYFNALLDPASDLSALYRLATDDDALHHIMSGVGMLSPRIANLISSAASLAQRAREIIDEEGISQPGDAIPPHVMGRVLSRLLVNSDKHADELAQIIKQAFQGQGVPVGMTRRLLQEVFADQGYDYEINAFLNWIGPLVSPGEPEPDNGVLSEPPIERNPLHAEAIAGVPSAAELYQRLASPTQDQIAQFEKLAPLLTLKQLDHVIHRLEAALDLKCDRLRSIARLRRKVQRISSGYGGLSYATQPMLISGLIADTLELSKDALVLSASDLASLLQAGIASARQGPRLQLNNYLLLRLLDQADPELLGAVLVEFSDGRPQALAGMLYALLEQDLDHLRAPITPAELLRRKLGHDVPLQKDFMAGGRHARDSYYAELERLAKTITADAEPYVARKRHVQRVRLAPPRSGRPRGKRADAAREAIIEADQVGHRYLIGEVTANEASAAYELAFLRCRTMLARSPKAFHAPWLKDFWARSEEALRIDSVIRNYQDSVDEVRPWLRKRSSIALPTDDQALLGHVVHALYHRPEDRAALLEDPMVRLQLPPPKGQYDVTLISCMGVITDGKDGVELAETYQRLDEQFGVKAIRAHTGTGRTLEYNASRIIDAILGCTGPWALVGYSQGCANALLAESLLLSGTPNERALLDRLVGRNMLFSAANGTVHGAAGLRKVSQAAIQGEFWIKHYQAIFSQAATRGALRALRATLDAPAFITLMGGTHSFSFERAMELHRDGQFRCDVPTSYTSAVVVPERLPELLDVTYYAMCSLAGDTDHDSQILVNDARPSASRVKNAYTDAFSHTEIPSRVQATHHWAPLSKTVDFVTTERDRDTACYQSPKDQLVLPWLANLARFGKIKVS